MTMNAATLAAILGMAAATYLTRIAGLWLVQRIRIEGRAAGALEAIPPAVLMAVIAPMALATGPAETLAALVAAVAATRLPLLLVVVVGVGAVVAFRSLIG